MDAAKHMWPEDIEATIDMVSDLPSGGRPYFYHEVIDQGEYSIRSHQRNSLPISIYHLFPFTSPDSFSFAIFLT